MSHRKETGWQWPHRPACDKGNETWPDVNYMTLPRNWVQNIPRTWEKPYWGTQKISSSHTTWTGNLTWDPRPSPSSACPCPTGRTPRRCRRSGCSSTHPKWSPWTPPAVWLPRGKVGNSIWVIRARVSQFDSLLLNYSSFLQKIWVKTLQRFSSSHSQGFKDEDLGNSPAGVLLL